MFLSAATFRHPMRFGSTVRPGGGTTTWMGPIPRNRPGPASEIRGWFGIADIPPQLVRARPWTLAVLVPRRGRYEAARLQPRTPLDGRGPGNTRSGLPTARPRAYPLPAPCASPSQETRNVCTFPERVTFYN
jgi:hypothetical protein